MTNIRNRLRKLEGATPDRIASYAEMTDEQLNQCLWEYVRPLCPKYGINDAPQGLPRRLCGGKPSWRQVQSNPQGVGTMRLKSRIERMEGKMGVGVTEPILVLFELVSPSDHGPVSEGVQYAQALGISGTVAREDGETEAAFIKRVEAMAAAGREARQT